MRLTQKDDQGNWCLRGLPWKQLHTGQIITREVQEKLYGALWKLMEYEDTGLTPGQIEERILYENNVMEKMVHEMFGEGVTIEAEINLEDRSLKRLVKKKNGTQYVIAYKDRRVIDLSLFDPRTHTF